MVQFRVAASFVQSTVFRYSSFFGWDSCSTVDPMKARSMTDIIELAWLYGDKLDWLPRSMDVFTWHEKHCNARYNLALGSIGRVR